MYIMCTCVCVCVVRRGICVFHLRMNGISVYASPHQREYLRNMNYESGAVYK